MVGIQSIHGFWRKEHKFKLSNNWELKNLVEVVEEEVNVGRMDVVDIFFLTYNGFYGTVSY